VGVGLALAFMVHLDAGKIRHSLVKRRGFVKGVLKKKGRVPKDPAPFSVARIAVTSWLPEVAVR
jgi:hypothetical protein